MLNLKTVSDFHLLEKTQALVAEERRLTTEILWHLYEIQRRRLFAEQGYSSLFEYAVKALGYSEAAAGRRIAAMRVLADVPEVEDRLKEGVVSLSTLCSVHHFLKSKDTPTSPEKKRELIQSLEGKSRRECERALAALAPEAMPPKERERFVSPTLTEIRFVADEALMEKLGRLRELDAHVNSDPSYLELFHRLADLALKRLDPELKKPKAKAPAAGTSPARAAAAPAAAADRAATPPAESRSSTSPPNSYIPAPFRREVWRRDGGCCTFVSADGKACRSRFALQFDHIVPVAHGGLSTVENLRLRCRVHNQLAAIQVFGKAIMGRFIDLGLAEAPSPNQKAHPRPLSA